MTKSLLFIWVSFLTGILSLCAVTVPDSLQKLLDAEKFDSLKARRLFKAASHEREINLDLAILYTNKGMDIANKIHSPRYLAWGYSETARNFQFAGNYKDAMHYMLKSARINDSTNDKLELGGNYLRMGEILDAQNDYKKSFKYYKRAREIFMAEKDTYDVIAVDIDIANDFSNINQMDSSLKVLFQALEIGRKAKDNMQISELLGTIGSIYSLMGKNEESVKYTREALSYFEKIGNLLYIAVACNNLAEAEFALNRYNEAEKYAYRSMATYRKAGIRNEIRSTYGILAKTYEKRKDFTQSIKWYKALIDLNDSIFNEETKRQTTEMETKYQTAIKEKSIAELKEKEEAKTVQLGRQQIIIYAAIVIILLILAGGGILFSNFRKISVLNKIMAGQKHQLESQNETLEELNTIKNKLFSAISHDLRSPLGRVTNMLYMIQGGRLTEEKLKARTADFLGAMRQTMQMLDNLLYWATGQMKGLVLQKDVLNVWRASHENVDLMQGEADSKMIALTENIEKDINAIADANMVRLIMRNLISNAIKFTPENGAVIISARKEGQKIKIEVKDTGMGMDKETIDAILSNKQVKSKSGTNTEKGFGIGLQLCRDFIEMNEGTFTIQSEPGKGSTFGFTLPAA